MMPLSRFTAVAVGALSLAVALRASADPLAALAAVSAFKAVDLEKRAGSGRHLLAFGKWKTNGLLSLPAQETGSLSLQEFEVHRAGAEALQAVF